MASFSPPRRTGYAPQVDAQGNQVSEALPNEFSSLAGTRQQLEQQLVAAHRTKNVQAAQQAAYAIRAYDQNVLSAQVPDINAPPPIDRVPKPTFGSWLGNVTAGIGEGLGEQVQGIGGIIERGVTAFAQDPLKASAAAFMTALEPARQGFTQPVQAAKDVGTGIVETGKQMYQQATSGPIGLGQTMGQMIDLPGPSLPGGKRRPTMAELDVYHGTPHTFDPEEGAPLGRFRSQKIGTGEGAQAYGYGLYLAEAPGTAKEYQVKLSSAGSAKNAVTKYGDVDSAIKATQESIFNYRNAIESGSGGERVKGMLQIAEKTINDLQDMKAGRPIREGSFYKVDLPDAKIEQMLDWDKPLSQQPENVRQALRGIFTREFESSDPTGANIYQALAQDARDIAIIKQNNKGSTLSASQQKASQDLTELGIPGIKYLDAGSRAGEKGTRNFVVFPGEEQSLTILERDGVKAEVPKADELAYHGTTKQAAAAIEREGFDLTRAADGTVWLTSNPNIGEVAATGKGGMVSRSVSGLKLGGWDEMDKYSTDELIAKGYDGLRLKDGDEITYQIFNPEKLKVPTKAEVPKPVAPVIDTTKPKREQLRQLHQQSGVSFVDATIDRGGAHTPAGPTSGSPAYDVALNGTYPEDFYGANGLRYYGTGYDEMDRQAYDKLRRLEGNPNSAIEVYRSVEKDGPKTISPGDWVTTVRDYAKDHGESALSGDYKIIKMLVNARDIYTAGDSMLEYGYHPQPRMPQLPKATK